MDGIVASRNGTVVARDRGRGIGPALRLYRSGALRGSDVADHIVGRAAAALFVAGGAARVHADVMSEGAARFLADCGVPATADVVAVRIDNRAGTGECPMELAVKDLHEPREMIAAIERELERLAARSRAGGEEDLKKKTKDR